MGLTPREEDVRDFMFDEFVPALHDLVSECNPTEYMRWNGNTCRQTAVFGYYYLTKLLPEYEWTAWDGEFSDIYMGHKVHYNHAWLHGINREMGKGLLVDLSRVDRERLFISVKENKYPKNHPEYKDMRLIRKEKMDIEKRMMECEYYTGMQGEEFIESLDLHI